MARQRREILAEEAAPQKRDVWKVDVYYLTLPQSLTGEDVRTKATFTCKDSISAGERAVRFVREGVTVPMGLYTKVIPPGRILEVTFYKGQIDA